ncbi:Piwi domain-containing protein [Lactifluus subvellereus]|nr:Piwi domain-containing protein [Lactifluus subvellereus]
MPPMGAPVDTRRGRSRGRGRGRGAGPIRSGGSPRAHSPPAKSRFLVPAAHVRAIGVKRPGHGSAGRITEVFTNHFAIELDHSQGTIHHYDVIAAQQPPSPLSADPGPESDMPIVDSDILPDEPAWNFKIINTLQTQVEPELFARPGVYDGRKNLFTAFELPFESGAREASLLGYTTSSLGEGVPRGHGPVEFRVRLMRVASINPQVLQPFLGGAQSHDNMIPTAITALNGGLDIGGGMVLWRGYFQSVRPAIDRLLINVDISTSVMYSPGPLIDLALAVLHRPGNPNALAPRHDLPDGDRIRLERFLSGIQITTSHGDSGCQMQRPRVVVGLSKMGARDLTLELGNGQQTTVADYFWTVLDRPLRFPDVICVELFNGALIPLELCQVIPGQKVRKRIPPNRKVSILNFPSGPRSRLESIRNSTGVLGHDLSEYVSEFGMRVANEPLKIQARVLNAPKLSYHKSSRQPISKPRDGAWDLTDKRMFSPSTVANWMVIIYEGQGRFNVGAANQMVTDLVERCEAVGMSINPRPALIRWESGQGDICEQLRVASGECQRRSGSLPTLIVVILPEDANDIYSAVKYFGDVLTGVVTQCMKSSRCFHGNSYYYSYYSNISLKLNVKLGGVNAVPELGDFSFLTDPANPTMVMGAAITHPAPGSVGRPSFTSLVGSIDTTTVRYVSTMEVQTPRMEVIEVMDSMCVYVLNQYKDATGEYPRRILFYRSGVSEGRFATVLEIELSLIRIACAKLGIKPAITMITVGKRHHVRFFPRSRNDGDLGGNCPAGTVVDSDVVNPIEFDFYLLSHGSVTGTSRPAHYNVLIDENNFTADGLQSLTYALCYVIARTTRSVSVPTQVLRAAVQGTTTTGNKL